MHAYDLIAKMCHKIELLKDEDRRIIFREYDAIKQNGKDEIESMFPFLSKTMGGIKEYNLFTEEQIKRMVDYIDDCKPIGLLSFLSYLDGYFDIDENFKIFCDTVRITQSRVSNFSSLSESTEGYLIPRFKSKWQKEHRHTLEELMEDPLSILQNYIWIDEQSYGKEISTAWKVSNIYSTEWNWSGNDSSFKIVCSPLIATCPYKYKTSFCENTHQNIFYITEYIETEEIRIKSIVERVLEYANTQKAHIVIFPETMVSKECQYELMKIVGERWLYSYPRLICLPSNLRKETIKWQNHTMIINGSGTEIFSYNKQHAFQLERDDKKYFEDIEADHQITIIHIKGVGRIAIIICADVFNQDIKEILFKKYKITLMLVIAYTCGTDAFFRSFAPAQEQSCDIVWCNTCAAYNTPEEGKDIKQEECVRQYNKPIAAYFPYGHKNYQGIIKNGCNNSCCDGCGIVISIPPKYAKDGEMDLIYFGDNV